MLAASTSIQRAVTLAGAKGHSCNARPLATSLAVLSDMPMRSQIKLGQVFSIKIGLHYSWFLIALLITFSLVSSYHAQHPQWSYALIVALGIVTAVLFFLSLLLHELAHSVVARLRGLPVSGITLFALGGVSQLGKEASNARDEFTIAIVGPATSALIGILCLAASLLVPAALTPIRLMLLWLGYINIGLSIFNLIPGYPMDGGRILRAFLWWKTNDIDRATRNAARVGQFIGMFFIVFGILSYFHKGGIGALWIAFIGWFILQAARESSLDSLLRTSFLEHSVGEFMSQEYPRVDCNETVQYFIDHTLLREGSHAAIVMQNDVPVGVVNLSAIKQVDRNLWPLMTLDRIMLPISAESAVTPATSIMTAMQTMEENALDFLPVVANGTVQGVLSRDGLMRRARTLIELQKL